MTWSDDINDRPNDAPDFGGDAWPSDGLDRLIADAAREYNTPPAVPRDAMWEAIMAARPPQAAAPDVPATPVISLAGKRAERTERTERTERAARNRGLVAVAAAAAIFLATGVGIGRWWGRGEQVAGSVAGSHMVAATPAPNGTPSTAPDATHAPNAVPDAAPDGTPDTTVEPTDVRRPTRLAAGRRPAGASDGRAPATDLYDVAVVRHFAQVEALLVSYRADTVDAAMDARLAAWARPLLGDTRLLLDSPAASDPHRRRLLEDLELVLAEVSRLAPADSAAHDSTARTLRTERQLIDGTLRRAQLLPRLRTLVPAGT